MEAGPRGGVSCWLINAKITTNRGVIRYDQVLPARSFTPYLATNDPKRSCREMQQAREFWIDSLMEINGSKNYRLGRIWQAAVAGKKCQHVHSIIERAV